jgi:hypothetical protein
MQMEQELLIIGVGLILWLELTLMRRRYGHYASRETFGLY